MMNKLLLALLAVASFSTQAQTAAPSREQVMMAQQLQVMAAMYDLRHSRYGFEGTVSAIKASAAKRAWKVGDVVDMQAQMQKAGAKDAKPMKVINLCPAGAIDRVAKASAGKAPPLPCRATVFVGNDGKVSVVHLNLHTLSKGTQGDLAKVLGELAAEEDALYKGIVE